MPGIWNRERDRREVLGVVRERDPEFITSDEVYVEAKRRYPLITRPRVTDALHKLADEGRIKRYSHRTWGLLGPKRAAGN
jgi:Fe2+ or Zn2+ uptake regulation protein